MNGNNIQAGGYQIPQPMPSQTQQMGGYSPQNLQSASFSRPNFNCLPYYPPIQQQPAYQSGATNALVQVVQVLVSMISQLVTLIVSKLSGGAGDRIVPFDASVSGGMVASTMGGSAATSGTSATAKEDGSGSILSKIGGFLGDYLGGENGILGTITDFLGLGEGGGTLSKIFDFGKGVFNAFKGVGGFLKDVGGSLFSKGGSLLSKGASFIGGLF